MCDALGGGLQELGPGEASEIRGGRLVMPPITLNPIEPPLFVPIDLQPRF